MAASEQALEEDGNWIPASRRPDGTWRKAIKVKEGYVPPDEVEKYQSKGSEWKKMQTNYTPGAEDSDKQTKKLTKNQKKNERRKAKRKEASDEKALNETTAAISRITVNEGDNSEKEDDTTKTTTGDNNDAVNKKIKNLKKKLRQVDDLQAKVDSGEIKDLTLEQKEKLARRDTLLRNIKDLERDLK